MADCLSLLPHAFLLQGSHESLPTAAHDGDPRQNSAARTSRTHIIALRTARSGPPHEHVQVGGNIGDLKRGSFGLSFGCQTSCCPFCTLSFNSITSLASASGLSETRKMLRLRRALPTGRYPLCDVASESQCSQARGFFTHRIQLGLVLGHCLLAFTRLLFLPE